MSLQRVALACRMGIKLGDFVDDGRDSHDEGMNVAAQIAGPAEPHGIRICGEVRAMVRHRVWYPFEDLVERGAEQQVSHSIRVIAIGPRPPVSLLREEPSSMGGKESSRRTKSARPSPFCLSRTRAGDREEN